MSSFQYPNVYAEVVKDEHGFRETNIYRENGDFLCKFPWYIEKQPRKNQKFITINFAKYKLNWRA